MRGIFAIPVTKLHPPARALVTRIAALQLLALCMRAPRNASGSIRMEFHAVKNPAALPPLLSAFFPSDLAFFIVAPINGRGEFALTLEKSCPAPF